MHAPVPIARAPAVAPAISPRRRIAFLYLGRRGGITRFAHEVGIAAIDHPHIDPLLILSDSNELLDQTQTLSGVVRTMRIFTSGIGMLTQAYRIPLLVHSLNDAFDQHRTEAVVVLASHVWSPFIAPYLRHSERPYIVIVHDADPHPGDFTALAHGWLLRDAARADRVIALSSTVTAALSTRRSIPSDRIVTLFHPVMSYVESLSETTWDGGRPLRLLFFGRLMGYKGLRLFADALALLRARGITVDATVAGTGSLNGDKERLEALGVTVINRWLHDQEIPRLLQAHDVVVLTHTEASQSGCAAAALGAGRPVITTPVGGLVEQITHEVSGLVAERVDAAAVAQQITRIVDEPELYPRLLQGVARRRQGHGMQDFLDQLLDAIPWNAH